MDIYPAMDWVVLATTLITGLVGIAARMVDWLDR